MRQHHARLLGIVRPRWGRRDGAAAYPGCASRPRALLLNAVGVKSPTIKYCLLGLAYGEANKLPADESRAVEIERLSFLLHSSDGICISLSLDKSTIETADFFSLD